MLDSLIHPEHSRKLLNTFTLGLTEAFGHANEDVVIVDLGLVVALRVVWRRKSMSDLILDTVSGYLLPGEICPVIRDDNVRKAKATHNILS